MKIEALFPIAQDLAIHFPNGEPTGITLKVVGQDSVAFRTVAKKFGQQMLTADAKPSINDLEAQNAELVSACVLGWKGLEDADGEPMAYSPEKALELLSKPELTFIREQVETFISKRVNFFVKSKSD